MSTERAILEGRRCGGAAGGGHKAVVQLLRDKGVYVDAAGYSRRIALHVAAREGAFNTVLLRTARVKSHIFEGLRN